MHKRKKRKEIKELSYREEKESLRRRRIFLNDGNV